MKRKIIFSITLVLIITSIITFYLTFIKSNIFFKSNNTTENSNNDTNIDDSNDNSNDENNNEFEILSETDFIDKYSKLGYKNLEIPTVPKFEQGIKIYNLDDEIININKDYEFVFYGYSDEYEYSFEAKINIKIKNNKAYFVYSNQELEIPINNVTKAYVSYVTCNDESFDIFFLTSSGDVYSLDWTEIYEKFNYQIEAKNENEFNKLVTQQLKLMISGIKKLNKNINYKNLIYISYQEFSTCGLPGEFAGNSFDNNIYILDTEIKFDNNYYPWTKYSSPDSNQTYRVNLNGDIINTINNENTNIKFKFSIYELLIDENNYVYKFIEDFDEIKAEAICKLEKQGKLKLLYANKSEKKVALLLDNNKVVEYNYEYDYLLENLEIE